MDALQRWLTLVGLVSAALAGLIYIGRQLWRGFRVMERLVDIVQHELSPNTGSSMKDDVAAIARSVGFLQRDVKQLTEDKETAHELLQLQLDTVADALGLPGDTQQPQHRREGDKT